MIILILDSEGVIEQRRFLAVAEIHVTFRMCVENEFQLKAAVQKPRLFAQVDIHLEACVMSMLILFYMTEHTNNAPYVEQKELSIKDDFFFKLTKIRIILIKVIGLKITHTRAL